LYQTAWGVRQKGTGPRAEQIGVMFDVFKRKHGLMGRSHGGSNVEFLRRKELRLAKGQLGLFG
jgi:hypothetical protein